MSNPPPEQRGAPSPADSPWFWMMIFCAAGLVILVVAWPQYVKRQARIELQYHAGEEIMRRRSTGEAAARDVGQEGDAPPPAVGDPIITLWPIAAILTALAVLSAGMFWRGRYVAVGQSSPRPAGEPP